MPITQLEGPQQDIARLLDLSPRANAKDYNDIISRLYGVPRLIEQTITLLQKGLQTGVTPPRITLRDVPQQIQEQTISDPKKNAILRPFWEFPAELTQSQ